MNPSTSDLISPLNLATWATGGKYQAARHLRVLQDAVLETLYSPDIDILVAMAPPRFGKTEFLGRWVPTWFHNVYPTQASIVSSYSVDLARNSSRFVRDKCDELAPVYGHRGVDQFASAASDWRMRDGGQMLAAGVGGGITGRSANLFIIDDVLKNAEEAISSRIRESQWEWFQTTAFTRMEPGGKLLVLGCLTGDTRILMDDGSEKEIRDIRPGDSVLSYHDGQHLPRRVLNHANVGVDKIYRVRVGNEVFRCNGRHPWLVEWEDGRRSYRRTRDLISTRGKRIGKVKAGIKIVMQKLVPGEGRHVSLDEAWLLGNMFGDGWVTVRDSRQGGADGKKYPRRGFVTCWAHGKNERLEAEWCECFERIFGFVPKRSRYGYRRTDVARVGRWLTDHGLVGKASNKRLPSWIYSQTVAIREAFLDGFMEADGWGVDTRGIQLCNEELLNDLRLLVRGLGYMPSQVHRSVRIAQPPNSPNPVIARAFSFSWTESRRCTYQFRPEVLASIESAGEEEVFDIEVEGDHNFIAAGCVSHNTRWHQEDLLGMLVSRGTELGVRVKSIRLPALAEPTPDDPDPLGRETGESLWPERWPVEHLERIRDTLEPYWWNALYQQRLGTYGKNEWPSEYFWGIMANDDEWPEKFAISATALDPSKGRHQRKGDYSAIVFAGFRDGTIWVDADLERRPVPKMMRDLVEFNRVHRPTVCGIEATAFQELLAPDYQLAQQEMGSYRDDPVLVENTVNKELRIGRLGLWLRKHKIKIRRNKGGELLLKQLKEFPNGQHEDGADALEVAIRLLCQIADDLQDVGADNLGSLTIST